MAVAYLRIGADKHYFSDVTLGALVGSAIGIGLPMLFHGREDEASETAAAASPASPAGAPATFALSGVF